MGRREGFAKPLPGDFAQRAASMTRKALLEHYGVGWRVLDRWRQQAGVTLIRTPPAAPPRPHRRRPVPDDFAAVAPTMTRRALRKHYVTSDETIYRWQKESGVAAGGAAQRAVPVRTAPQREFVFGGHAAGLVLRDMRQRSAYDDAADVLRRERFVVYRCDERGRADIRGKHWRIGNSLLTPDELLARAARYRRNDLQAGIARSMGESSASPSETTL